MTDDARGPSIGPSVAEILASHAGGTGSPTKTAARVADAIAARGDDGTWLSTVPRDQLIATAEAIETRSGARTFPLYGVPFAVKDSIDVEGVPTTLSCPDYAYVASTTAPVVRKLAVWYLAVHAMAIGDPDQAHQWLCAFGKHERLTLFPLFPMEVAAKEFPSRKY